MLQIYSYLSELEHCPCFQKDNRNVDIAYMKFFQVLEIITYFILIFSLFSLKYGKGGKNEMISFVSVITVIISLIVMGYMGYNVILFYKSLKNDCECANKWQKYFIYAQGLFSSISALQLSATFLFIVQLMIVSYVKF